MVPSSFFRNACALLTLSLALPPELALTAQQAFRIVSRTWFIWGVWWLAMAFFSKSTKRSETPLQRIEHLAPAALGFALIFSEQWRWRYLSHAIFPDISWLMLSCVAAAVLGLLFSSWARLALGANWSGTITIKKNHQLIRRGPYRFIRHPIYTGMLAALLAAAITQQLVSGLLGFAIVVFALYRKARREESFLSQEFGEDFIEHCRHTGMFLPRFS